MANDIVTVVYFTIDTLETMLALSFSSKTG